MATLTTETVVDKLELDESGNVSIRLATYYDSDGTRDESTKKYHRITIPSGTSSDDVTTILTANQEATSLDFTVSTLATRVVALMAV